MGYFTEMILYFFEKAIGGLFEIGLGSLLSKTENSPRIENTKKDVH